MSMRAAMKAAARTDVSDQAAFVFSAPAGTP
ncbi:hypothetical protein PCA31118_00167 [Pandoraea captiosa]|uniref:Uncharacterized protein n=1 Tax=Pandoraea captiosa TaxID=2508302 RepID=A0A5E4ZIL5_9BURK|nr:hypothetical protein PCA31118_00167 [Pandoraea captiosa]